jgi:hypothetical protein
MTDIYLILLTEYDGNECNSYITNKKLWDWISDANPLPPQDVIDELWANKKDSNFAHCVDKQELADELLANPKSGSFANDKAISAYCAGKHAPDKLEIKE